MGDIVILLRTTAGWDEVFKRCWKKSGIPVYITSKTGYFAATEVQTILNFLKVLSNPLQDIPLFGVLKSDAAGFTDEDIACMKAEMEGEGRRLFTCLTSYTEKGSREELCEKARRFCSMLERFRRYVAYMPIHQLIEQFLKETGYLYTISALPGGGTAQGQCGNAAFQGGEFRKDQLFRFVPFYPVHGAGGKI